jgi:hypothetical protein
VSQTWNDENYDQQPYDEQYYEQTPYAEELPPAAGRRPTGLLTMALIIGVVACSCLSCLIGTGLGLVVWDEINYTPESGAAAQPPPTTRTRAAATTASWLSTDVVDAFLAAGLECQDPQPLPVGDATEHFVAAEATRCLVPGACEGCSGRIYSFDNQAELNKAKRYYTDLGNQDPQFVSWLYSRDNILVQLNGRLPEEQAAMYRQALMGMR